MSNIAGALYRVTKIANEMKCSRRMKSVSRQCQFKQPCLQAAPEGKEWQYVASLHAVKHSSGKCNILSCDRPRQVYNTSGWGVPKFVDGGKQPQSMTRNLSVTLKTTLRSGKSEA